MIERHKRRFTVFPFIMLEPFGAVVDCRSLFPVYFFKNTVRNVSFAI